MNIGTNIDLNLTGQKVEADKIRPLIEKFELLLTQRQSVWAKDRDDRKKWIDSNNDPILTLAFNHYKFLKEFFGELD